MDPAALPLALDLFGQDLSNDLIEPLGGAAAALALFGLILLLPLYVTHRREIARLLDWQEREPELGEPEGPRASAADTTAPTTGSMSAAAARVTSERPALARIGTAERAAIDLEQAPFWRRVVERGPRHPLVVSLLALLLAGAVFAGAALLLRADDERQPSGKSIVASEVDVVVLNASTATGLAGNVAGDVEANNFVVTGTTAASETADESVVLYAPGAKTEGRAVSRKLEIRSLLEFDREAEAAADGASVVVIVGEDLAEAANGPE